MNFGIASRCRKKRKTLLQDLEKHAKEVSDLNQTLTVQVQTLSAQMQILYGQLDIFKDCSCGAAEKARGLLGETGLRVSHPLPFPMNPTTNTEILNVRAHSSNVCFLILVVKSSSELITRMDVDGIGGSSFGTACTEAFRSSDQWIWKFTGSIAFSITLSLALHYFFLCNLLTLSGIRVLGFFFCCSCT